MLVKFLVYAMELGIVFLPCLERPPPTPPALGGSAASLGSYAIALWAMTQAHCPHRL